MGSHNNNVLIAKASLGLMLCVLLVRAQTSHALSLTDAYQAALTHDPIYRAAQYENAAGQQARDIGLSALLPSAGFSYGYSTNSADYTQTLGGNRVTRPLDYDSKVLSVSVRQPLFSLEALARYKQGGMQSDYAEAVFTARAHELMMRVVSAYLETLAAGDQLRLIIAQRDALTEMQDVNRRRFDKGEGTRTEVLETKARAELAQAQVVEAQDALDAAMRKLRAIVGRDIDTLRSLPKTLTVLPLVPNRIDEWETLARESNPNVRARRYLVDIAEQDVRKSQSGHLPKLDLIASHSRSTSDSVLTYNQQTVINSVGIQFNLPIFSGGATSASVRQGADLLSKSRAELDNSISTVLIEVRRQYNLIISSQSRIEALINAEASAQEALAATRKSIAGGLRINLDLLNAQQQLYATQRDLAQARYGYLLAYMRLHEASGVLGADALQKIDREFQLLADLPTTTGPSAGVACGDHKKASKCSGKDSIFVVQAGLPSDQVDSVALTGADKHDDEVGDEAVEWRASRSAGKKPLKDRGKVKRRR